MPDEKYKIKGIEIDAGQLSFRFKVPEYKPSEKQLTVVSDVTARFRVLQSNRDKNYRWFGKMQSGTYRNLVQYLDMSRKRWNSDGIPRTELESWQASVFKPETRNKIIAIISAVAQQRPGLKFKSAEEDDLLKERVITDLYNVSEEKDNGDEVALYAMLDAIIDGTVIRYEGYDENVRVIREIDPDSNVFADGDATFKEKQIIKKKVVTKDVALQDFYPGNVRLRTTKMDEQPDCVWRKVMRYNDFRSEFQNWKYTKYVLPGGDITDDTFYKDYVSDEIRDFGSDLVEVIRYYNREADQFIIIANGVWINPIKDNGICPLPFYHKELPFWGFVFEPFASDFFYGKSGPDKWRGEQDAINALYNIMIDQGFISGHPIILTGSQDAIDDIDLVPGRFNYVGADVNQFKELQLSGNSNSQFNLLNLLHQSLQESSVDSVQSGQTGDAGTATEVRQAAAAATRIFFLFIVFVFHGYKRKGQLRMKNILQFLTSPDIITKYIGESGEQKFEEAFSSVKVHNTSLSNGKKGSRIIQMVSSKEELTQAYNNREADRAKLEAKSMEKITIMPEYIRDAECDVIPIPDSTVKETPEVLRALELEFQKTTMMLYPDKVNRDAMFDDYLEVFGKEDKDLKIQQPITQLPQESSQGSPGGAQAGGTGVGNQVLNQSTGGPSQMGTGGLNLNQLQ